MAEWKISNDLPYLDEFPIFSFISEYPNAMWRQANGELPFRNAFPEFFKFTDTPNAAWQQVEEELPYKNAFPDFIKFTDAPNPIWQQSNGDLPYKRIFPETNELGAFCHATNLRNVIIPESVKKIGRFAFRYTKLTEVTIAADCEYYETSFPEGCRINFYGELSSNFSTADGYYFYTVDNEIIEVQE